MGVKIGLQDEGSGDLIQVTGALLARDTHLDAGSAGFLGAEGFVPEFDGQIGLGLECLGKTRRAATCQVGLAVFIKRLADDDQPGSVLGCQCCDLGCVDGARDMLNDGQWVGDGAGRVTESETDALFAVINC